MIRLALSMFLLLLPVPALAWGSYAHRLTASIALARLTPSARAQLRELLRAAPALDTPTCPLASIHDASVWPDCVRALPGGRFGYSAPWHYQNISVCGDFDIAANCPDGNCVTAQIPRQQAILADRSRPAPERLQALAFLVHLVGDVHQPLHVGDKGDLGGNRVRANYGVIANERLNLHGIWDGQLAERALTEPPAITPRTIPAATTGAPADTAAQVAIWARESWDVSRAIAYPALPDTPDACAVPGQASAARSTITPAYIAAATPAVRNRVAMAGVRIALLINAALAPPAEPPRRERFPASALGPIVTP